MKKSVYYIMLSLLLVNQLSFPLFAQETEGKNVPIISEEMVGEEDVLEVDEESVLSDEREEVGNDESVIVNEGDAVETDAKEGGQNDMEEPFIEELLEGNYVEGEVLVRYKEEPLQTFSTVDEYITLETLPLQDENISLVKGSNGESTAELIEKLLQDPNVEYVGPNHIYTTFDLPYNDPYTGHLRGLYSTTDGAADIDRLPAMQILEKGEITAPVVAVIDIGIKYDHPDIINQLWTGACVNTGGNDRGECLYGYNATNDDKTPTPYGTDYHGTHVAGIIAAQMNNNEGVIGVNPYAKLMLINTSLTESSIIRGINFAKFNGAKIINASRGGTGTSEAGWDTIKKAIQSFTDEGGIFITAAGNNSNDNEATIKTFPCNFSLSNPNVICVGASNENNQLATNFSNYGNSINIAAPGTSILNTRYNGSSFSYVNKQGTSMATPHVAGTISLLWTYAPQASDTEVINALYEGADVLAGNVLNRHINGDKKLNVYNSLLLLDTVAPIITASSSTSEGYCLSDSITYTFTGIDDIQLADKAYSFDNGLTRGTGNTYTTGATSVS